MEYNKNFTIDELGNINDERGEPTDFNESVGKFIQKVTWWAQLYEGTPRLGVPFDGYQVAVNDLLNDLLLFGDGVFDATIERDSRSLRVFFANGQIFRFIVEEEIPLKNWN